jgi:nicotinate-nucleotide pyrophosphorylase (carboxylating)
MMMPKMLLQQELMRMLKEDVGQGDITTTAVVSSVTLVQAKIIAKQTAVVAGILEAKALFEMLDIKFVAKVEEGVQVPVGTVIAEVAGDGRTILMAERTVLNILMRMSGIATETKKLVERVQDAGLSVRVAATRKTAPGLRYFDKRAVTVGGGDPHRMRLDDAFLVKDNHIMIAGGIDEAVKHACRAASFSKKVEVEAKTKAQAVQAAMLGADIVMLDNMTVEEAKETMDELAARNLRDKVLIEISGNIAPENLIDYATLGPDIVSLGSLTHSVKAVDISLEVVEVKKGK